eukprot:1161969-Pelagomonas_calceolata.AAC.14
MEHAVTCWQMSTVFNVSCLGCSRLSMILDRIKINIRLATICDDSTRKATRQVAHFKMWEVCWYAGPCNGSLAIVLHCFTIRLQHWNAGKAPDWLRAYWKGEGTYMERIPQVQMGAKSMEERNMSWQ